MVYKKISICSAINFILIYLYHEISIVYTLEKFTKLPKNVKPIHYTLTITPYFDEKHSEGKNFTFQGNVQIEFEVLEDTFNLKFDSEDLNINESSLYVKELHTTKSTNEKIVNQTIDEESNFYIIDFEEPLIKNNNYIVYIEYDGRLKNSLIGFYVSSYTTKNNETKWIGMTKFSKNNARKTFPCFDHPALKSTFDIRIKRLSNYTVLSNMPLKTTVMNSSSDGRVMDIFETTKKMSTYLVAWVISDFKKITNEFGNHSIWANEDVIEYTKHSLDVAIEVLKFMEEFLNIEYYLPKLDHIASIEMRFLAMENWGLITYRPELLMFNPEEDTLHMQYGGLHTLVHEIAHQWFGNLVTCKSWNYLWLNEGFARYMEHKALSQVKPDWRINEQFILRTLKNAYNFDSIPNISAIYESNKTSNMIHPTMLSYEKPAVILRMLEHAFTTPIFRTALQNYLKEMKEKSAIDKDFWRNLQKAVDKSNNTDLNLGSLTVVEIADNWFKKSRYPIVTVERINSSTLKLSQQTYSQSLDDSEPSDWWIPINFATKKNPDFDQTTVSHWLGKDPIYIECDESDWIILNKQGIGYYRVKYDENEWEKIINLLLHNHTIVSPVNRAKLLDDSYTLSNLKYIQIESYLNLTRYLQFETDYIVWNLMSNKIESIIFLLANSSDSYHSEYLHQLVRLVYNNVDGFNEKPTDDFITKLKRMTVLKFACNIYYNECLENAHKILLKYYTGEIKAIDINIKNIVYQSGIRVVSNETWELLFNRIKNSQDENDRSILIEYLGCTKNKDLSDKYILFLLDFDNNGLSENEQLWSFSDLHSCRNKDSDISIQLFENYYNFFTTGLESIEQEKFAKVLTIILPQGENEKLRNFIENSNKINEETKDILRPVYENKQYSYMGEQTKDVEKIQKMVSWFNEEYSRMVFKNVDNLENEIFSNDPFEKNITKSYERK